jgi:arsenite oxidase small subunit
MGNEQSRRTFLQSAVASSAAGLIGSGSQEAHSRTADKAASLAGASNVERPIAFIGDMKDGSSATFNYPDKDSPCMLIKTGNAVPGGVGPQHDVVAYSAMCTHMGCQVSYDATSQTIKCPCHFSVFDPERDGQMVCGQTTENLPRIQLTFDESSGRISAVGVQGHLYGRVTNIL